MTAATQREPALRDLVADEVRAWLGRRRMSGAQLARALGKSQSFVARRLDGRQPMDLDDLEMIAGVLRVPVSALLPSRIASAANAPTHATVSERYQAISGQVVPLFAQVKANGRKNRRSRLGHLAELGQVSELRPTA